MFLSQNMNHRNTQLKQISCLFVCLLVFCLFVCFFLSFFLSLFVSLFLCLFVCLFVLLFRLMRLTRCDFLRPQIIPSKQRSCQYEWMYV